jgi:hypothetical protein
MNKSVGLHDIESATYLFISNENTPEGRYSWYTLVEGENGQANKKCISQKALTGKLEKLELKDVEVKACKKVETKPKLDIHIKADGDKYVIRTGIDTTFYKGLLLKLNALTDEQLANNITITATASVDSDKVVFAGVRFNDESIRANWEPEANFFEIIDQINEVLKGHKEQTKEADLALTK